MKNFKYILASLFLLAQLALFGQQDMILYQFRSLNQSSYLNPAFSGDSKVSIGIPGISSFYFSYNNNAFQANDVFSSDLDLSVNGLRNTTPSANEFVDALLDPGSITNNLTDRNYLMTNFQLDLFHLKINKGKHSFGFNVTEKVSAMIVFPKSLFELIQNGNGGANLGQTISVNGLGPDFSHYREFGFSYSQIVNQKLSLGGRLKILSGMENVSFSKSHFGWTTDELDYSWDITGSYTLNTSGVANGMAFEDLLMGKGNRGFGLDLGASYQVNDQLNLSASITDLGFINWSNDNMIVSTDDFSIDFDGIDVFSLNDSTDIGSLFTDVYESAIDSINGQMDSTSTYNTRLHPRVLIGGNYSINDKLNLGLLLQGQFYGPVTKYGASVSANYQVLPSLSAVASYTVTDKSYNNVGIGMMWDKGPVQIYAITDNILGLNISNTQNVHARLGINVALGSRNPKPVEPNGDDVAPVMISETEETDSVEDLGFGDLPAVDLPAEVEEPKVETFYELFCEVIDADTELELTGFIVEVYKKEIGGAEVMSSNRPYNSGAFLKQFERETIQRIVVKKAGFEDGELFIFPDDVGDKPEIRETIALIPMERIVLEEEEESVAMVSAFELTARTSLRSEASSTSIVLERISEGTLMEVLEETNKYWWKVNLNGTEGYVKASYLIESEQQLNASETVGQPVRNYTTSSEEGTGSYYFLIEKTSLRSEPTSSSAVMLRFGSGDEVELVEKTTKYWWKVIFDGKVGFVKAAKLEE